MSYLTPESAAAVVAALLVILVRRQVAQVLAVIDRIPSKEWFERVEGHLQRGHDLAQAIQTHEFKLASHSDGLERGRVRMNRMDEHIAATDAKVSEHETRLQLLEAK